MTKPTKYKMKPVDVEVMGPLTRENAAYIAEWSGSSRKLKDDRWGTYMYCRPTDSCIYLGWFLVRRGRDNWVVEPPDDFHATYEPQNAFDGISIVLTNDSLEQIVTDLIAAQWWDVRDTVASGVRKLQAAILARQAVLTSSTQGATMSEFAVGDVVRFLEGPSPGESEELTVIGSRPAGSHTSYTLRDEANPGADIRSYGSELELVHRRS